MSRNKIISMTDFDYFPYGKLFMETSKIVDAEIVCYTPSVEMLKGRTKNITLKNIDEYNFKNRMQLLKFLFLSYEDGQVFFCDWDTFFLKNPFEDVPDTPTIGITIRSKMIDKKCLRAYANGGVIYSYKAQDFWRWAISVCEKGCDPELPEYDEVWRTLEDKNRSVQKRHSRENLRWWVDQVFLSAIVKQIVDGGSHIVHGVKVKLLDEKYNFCDATYNEAVSMGAFIGHLKSKGAPASMKDVK